MTKKSPEVFQKLCDLVADSLPWETAAKAIGISAATLWRWIKDSKAGSPEFIFDYQGEQIALHDALKQCASMSHVAILQSAEHRARYGCYLQAHYKGRPQWQEDPDLMKYSDSELEALGIDRWQRDEKGALVPVLIWEPPPVQLLQTVLAARFAKVYGSKQQIEVTNKTGGVSVIRHQHSFEKPPEPVAVIPPPIIVEPDEDADKQAYWERQLDEVEQAEVEVEPESEETEAMATGPNPEVIKADTPLRRELEALARARRDAAPQPIRPPPASAAVEPDRDTGHVRPGGFKVK
jgi:hypothetical protein